MDGDDPVTGAFEILKHVRRDDTVYSLVYDLNELQIHVVTNRNQTRRVIRLDSFDFTPNASMYAVDLQSPASEGSVVTFMPYSTALNLQAVESFFRDPALTSVFQWQIPDEVIHYIARYPESIVPVGAR